MIIAVVILSLALIICVVLVFMLKKDIGLLNRSLVTVKQADTNMRLTTSTFDKNICTLCDTINDVLDKQQKIAIASEKSNREFRQAITNVSHDLRTPLTSAIGYIQMIKSDKTLPEKKAEYLNIIENRLKSLSKLMNELFEYTQITEGKIAQNIEKVNICNILRDDIADFYSSLTAKNFNVQINIPDTPFYTMCDPDLFRRVVGNLMQNVLLHGVEQFELTVNNENSTVTFKNKVKNIGMLDVDRLFERFYTSDVSRSGNNTGLGLAIVKELINNMGGDIKALQKDDMLEISICLRQAKGMEK